MRRIVAAMIAGCALAACAKPAPAPPPPPPPPAMVIPDPPPPAVVPNGSKPSQDKTNNPETRRPNAVAMAAPDPR